MTQIPNDMGGQQPVSNDMGGEQFDRGDFFVPPKLGNRGQTPKMHMAGLFKPVRGGPKKVGLGEVRSGAVIRFNYTLWKHDPYPLVIVTDRMPDGDVRGVNLRYFILNYVVQMIRNYCGKPGFSFRNIAPNRYFVGAFRRYKSFGMRNIEMLDCDLILKTIDMIRTHDPNQQQAMREAVQEQLRKKVNVTAEELTKAPGQTTQPPQQQREYNFMQPGPPQQQTFPFMGGPE